MGHLTKHLLKPGGAAVMLCCASLSAFAADKIVHDGEYYILEAQHGERWDKEDQETDEMLATIRARHGGKRPNIVYILHRRYWIRADG